MTELLSFVLSLVRGRRGFLYDGFACNANVYSRTGRRRVVFFHNFYAFVTILLFDLLNASV